MSFKILIIDIETTNFFKDGGAIVEVGIVSLDLETGEREIVFDSVCREKILSEKHRKPPFGWIFWNSDLTVEEVRAAPDLTELKVDIQRIIDSYPLGVTAYNRNFDVHFLQSRGFSFPRLLPCPMKLATPICKLPSPHLHREPYKWPSVEEAWKHFFPDMPYKEAHRGADDAMHEAMIVWELYQRGVFVLDEDME